jgi:L-aminopeptidase/D-esterase-like protein
VDQRGGAPGTRETDLLRPLHLVEKVNAILLSGGSAFGLEAATGVVRYLEERGYGYETAQARVPIVPAAILFDLALGRADIRPDAAMGYQACLNATSDPVVEGNAGAGMGATVGKIMGMSQAVKAGVGSASLSLSNGLVVGALAAVNALGDVVDPANGRILAGARSAEPAKGPFVDSMTVLHMLASRPALGSNTTIGVVASNARLTKEQANWVAQMAQDGLARTIRPSHTLYDGDTIFALSTGDMAVDFNIVGALAAEVFTQAVVRAVRAAEPIGGLPSIRSM